MTVPSPNPADASAAPTASPAEYDAFAAAHPDLQAVEFLIVDPNGILRGKWAPADALKKAFADGINFPVSIHGLDVWGREVPATGLHIESGDRDGFFRAVPGQLLPVPWAARDTAQVLLSTFTADGAPFGGDARNALARLAARAGARGLTPVVAFELEFYLVETDPATGLPVPVDADAGPDRQRMYGVDALHDRAALIEDIRAYAEAQGLPIDTIVKEAAPGQYEVNLKHRADALRAADDVILLRRLIQAAARQHGLTATFMAKPFIEPAGNGMHVHVSLLDQDGNNIFASEADGVASLHGAIAALIETMPETVLLFINTWNGFRRIQPGSYAPTRAVWGENNRSVALRIPASNASNRRIEHRIAGADANPYLVLAAILEAMLEGIDKKGTPPPPVDGNAYDADAGAEHLPDDMPIALDLFRDSAFAARALGQELRDLIAHVKDAEIAEFRHEISPLERSTYL